MNNLHEKCRARRKIQVPNIIQPSVLQLFIVKNRHAYMYSQKYEMVSLYIICILYTCTGIMTYVITANILCKTYEFIA